MLTADVQWPADVDPARREQHLTDQDFETVFGMALGVYQKLPAWKRLQLKKLKSLF